MHGRLQSVCWCFFVFCFLPRARRLRWLAGSDVVHARPREVVAAPVVRGGHGHHQALRRPLHLADARAKHNVRAQSHDSLRVVHTVGGVRPLTIFAHVHVLQSLRKKLGRSIAIIGTPSFFAAVHCFWRRGRRDGNEEERSGFCAARSDFVAPKPTRWAVEAPRVRRGGGAEARTTAVAFCWTFAGKMLQLQGWAQQMGTYFPLQQRGGGGYWYCCSLHTIPLVVFQKGTTTLAKGV